MIEELIINVCMFLVLCILSFLCGVVGYVLGRKKEAMERNCEECFLKQLKEKEDAKDTN